MQLLILHFYKACVKEFSGALFWNNTGINLSVTQPCSKLHSSFRSGVEIRRKCNDDRTWTPVDMSNCTMHADSNPVLIVYFTVIINDSDTVNSTIIINNVSSKVPT